MKAVLAGVLAIGMTSAFAATTARAETKEVVLRLQPKVSMESLAQSVTDPASPRYRQFYTPAELRSLAGPDDAAYDTLIQKLRADNVEIVRESPTHLYVVVRGERSYLAKMESDLKSPLRGLLSLFSSGTGAAVESVNGLRPSVKRRPHLRFLADAEKQAKKKKKKQDPAQFNGYSPAQIQEAYGISQLYAQGITGKGQDIAIATYNGFYMQDITDYYTQNKVSPAPVVDQVSFNGTAALDAGSATETQTDAEFSGMIAPGASIHIYASADNSDAGELETFQAILDDGKSKIVNYSWGACEKDVDASHKTDMDKVFAQAVAQGVNITVATGDSGSDCEQDGSTVADFPAVEPNVIAVGGTSLTIGSNGSGSETAWTGSGASGGSGGGISTLYASPSFQSVLSSEYTSGRAYPDVAFNADPATGEPTYVHYDPSNPDSPPATAQYVVIGGTSIAAPQWAGFLALVNNARGSNVGYLNPIIYAAAAQNQTQYFNDVTSGNNGAYNAGPGWDAVTGWGSMQASALLSLLKGQ